MVAVDAAWPAVPHIRCRQPMGKMPERDGIIDVDIDQSSRRCAALETDVVVGIEFKLEFNRGQSTFLPRWMARYLRHGTKRERLPPGF
jgi:hypothetical protein